MHRIASVFHTSGIVLFLSSCMVGPDFQHPPSPQTATYIQNQSVKKTIKAIASQDAGKAQYFETGRDIPGEWWRVFQSHGINNLILAGFRHSPTIAAAKAAVVVADENLNAQIGTLFPTVTANFLPERQKLNGSAFNVGNLGPITPRTFNLFNTNVAAIYTLDVFGGLRRQIEAVGAQLDFQKFELEAAYLNLASSIVTTSINIAALQAQIDATYELIKAQKKTLVIVNGQFNIGGASKADVLLQETQLSSTYATLPPLQQNLAIQYHALSVLSGTLPREDKFPALKLDALHLPRDLPLSCPSLLTRQRPDVRAAEALLHAASAQIGVATANLFPQVILNGGYGWQSNMLNTLITPTNQIWNIGASVAQTIFQGGTLIAQKRAAIAAYEQAAAQYKQTVLQAFQNVADSLRALQNDAELLKSRKQVEMTALQTLNLTQGQFQLGGASFLDLLIAQRAYQVALISRIQAQSNRYLDTVSLFQALGGGWWNPPPAMVVVEDKIAIHKGA